MSIASSCERDESSHVPIARAVVPMLVAAGAVTLAIAVLHGEPSAQVAAAAAAGAAIADPGASASDATSYSADHRRVEEAPGDPEPLPAQF